MVSKLQFEQRCVTKSVLGYVRLSTKGNEIFVYRRISCEATRVVVVNSLKSIICGYLSKNLLLILRTDFGSRDAVPTGGGEPCVTRF